MSKPLTPEHIEAMSDEPFCRDCADENGTCPADGLPCKSSPPPAPSPTTTPARCPSCGSKHTAPDCLVCGRDFTPAPSAPLVDGGAASGQPEAVSE